MNTKTKEALAKLADAVANLAMGSILTIGSETAIEITNISEQLKIALNHDETILEVS